MTPRLPPELLSHILALACQDEPALVRRETRDAFSLVCRDWCQSIDKSSEIAVNSADELEGVAGWLSGGRKRSLSTEAGQRVKSLFVRLTSADKRASEDRKQVRELNRVLKLASGLQRLELELSCGVLTPRQAYKGDLNLIALRSIAQLVNLKSLSITGIRRFTLILDLNLDHFQV